MDPSNATIQEINANITNLIADREQLQAKLGYAMSTISELMRQNEQLELLLSNAQFQLHANLQTSQQAQSCKVRPKTSCIQGTWLSDPTATPFLTPAEIAWDKGKNQKALALLAQILNQKNITESNRANTELLCSVILRTSGNVEQAQAHVQKSVSIAEKAQLYDLRCKAHFHKGLCYMHETKYDQALWCFVRAFYTPGYEELVKTNTELAVQKLLKLPSDDPKRKLFSTEELMHFLSLVGR